MNDIVIYNLDWADFYQGFPQVLESLAPVGLSQEKARSFYDNHAALEVQRQTFVALDGEKVVGTATVLLEQKFIHEGGKVAHIEDVAVLPEYQGHGIGSALLARCIKHAKDERCYKAVLNCKDELQVFYEQQGFYRSGIQMRVDLALPGRQEEG